MAQPTGIPANQKGTIRAAEQAGEEGVQSGAEGLVPMHPPGGQRQNLPAEVRDLLPPPGWNVP